MHHKNYQRASKLYPGDTFVFEDMLLVAVVSKSSPGDACGECALVKEACYESPACAGAGVARTPVVFDHAPTDTDFYALLRLRGEIK